MTNEDQSDSVPGGDEPRGNHAGPAGKQPRVTPAVAGDTENPSMAEAGENDGKEDEPSIDTAAVAALLRARAEAGEREDAVRIGVLRAVMHALYGTGGAAFFGMAEVFDILIEEARAAEQAGVHGANHALHHLEDASNEVAIAHNDWLAYVRYNY